MLMRQDLYRRLMYRLIMLARLRRIRGLACGVTIAIGSVACGSSDRSSDYDTLDVTVSVQTESDGSRLAIARADVGRLTGGDRVNVRYAGETTTLYRREQAYRYTAPLRTSAEPVGTVAFDVMRGSGGDTVTLEVPIPVLEDFTILRREPGIDARNPVELSWRLIPADDQLQTTVNARPVRCEDSGGNMLASDQIARYELTREIVGERIVVVPGDLLDTSPPAGTLCRYAVSLSVRVLASTSGAPRDNFNGESFDSITVRSGYQALEYDPQELDVRFGGEQGAL